MPKEDLKQKNFKEILELIKENPETFMEVCKKNPPKQDVMAALDNHIQKHKADFSPELIEFIEDRHVNNIVGSVKQRPLANTSLDNWQPGLSKSRLVKKTKDKESNNTQKFKNTWIEKVVGAGDEDPSEQICEYLASNMMKLHRYENSPRFRLYSNDNQVTGASKFIHNFESFHDKSPADKQRLQKEGKGFASLLSSSILSGNYDLHSDNIGSRTDANGQIHWAGIDHGRGLSYNMAIDFNGDKIPAPGGPQTAAKFIEGMDKSVYNEELFQGFGFACELVHEVDNINLDRMKKVIQGSIKNLRQAYGEDFLENQDIENLLREKMGISRPTELSIQIIEDTIMNNMERLQGELQEIAQQAFIKAIEKEAPKSLSQIMEALDPRPENMDLFMAYAEHIKDEKAIEYLQSQNVNSTTLKWKEEDINALDAEGRTKASIAIGNGDLEEVNRLIEVGADLNIPDNNSQWTPLHYAVICWQQETIDALIKARVNLDLQDNQGKSPLHHAVENENAEAMEALVKGGANLDIQDNEEKKTSLHYAITSENIDAVRSLVDAGASLEVLDINEMSPLQYAENNEEISQILQEAQEKRQADVIPPRGPSPRAIADVDKAMFEVDISDSKPSTPAVQTTGKSIIR
jgi:ankyrin repeat protein